MNRSDKSENSSNSGKLGCFIILAIVAGCLLILTAPFWHDFVMLFYTNLPTLIAIVVTVVLLVIAAAYSGLTRWVAGAFVLIGVLTCLVMIFFSGSFAEKYMVSSLTPTVLSAPLETKDLRYVPKQIAVKKGESKTHLSNQVLGDFDPMDDSQSGEIVWSSPREPNGLVNSFLSNTDGVSIIREKSVDFLPQKFDCGEGMSLGRSADWQFIVTHYFAKHTDPYYVQSGNEILTISPYITYNFVFPSMVPNWGGVMVMHPNCRVEDLSPEQAINDPRFVDNRLYPEELAHMIARGWQYRNGIINASFQHVDQTALPVLGNGNEMPFLLSTNQGLQWFSALEPSGSGSHGVSKLLYIDAHKGSSATSITEYKGDQSLTGPVVAEDYIRGAFPSYSWQKNSGGSFVAIEPRPIVRNGQFFWLYSITTTDYTDVTESPLLNAIDGTVYSCHSKADLKAFVAGKESCLLIKKVDAQEPSKSVDTPVTSPAVPGDSSALEKMTDQQLIDLQQQILDEWKRRQQK